MEKLFRKKSGISILVFCLCLLLIFLYFQKVQHKRVGEVIGTEATPASDQQPKGSLAQVVRVVDGDTLSVMQSGKKETVRVLGINTPETVDPRKPVQCFGVAASNKAKELLVAGSSVELESDPTQSDRDKYGRLLRYVWQNNGTIDYGKTMIENGYAYEYTYDTPYKYQAEYKAAQKEASDAKKGLWADNTCDGQLKAAISMPATTKEPSLVPSGNSDTGDKDCSDFTTQKEAQAYFDSHGGSASHDVDGLDRDHNGVVCESLP